MALKAILDSLDSVPDAQRGLYVAKDGKFYLDVDQDSAEEAFASGLKRNRDEALKEARAAKAKLAAYDGVDAEEFKRLKDAAAEADRKKAAAEGDFKALEKQLIDKHGQELGAKDKQIEKRQKALERRLVDAELTRAIAAHKGDPDLLLNYARQFVRVKETDDDFEGFVADEKGNPRIADGKGTPMTFDTFVSEHLMVKFPRAFEGTGSSGGGASKSAAAGGGGAVKVVPRGDNKAFVQNVDALADGTAELR